MPLAGGASDHERPCLQKTRPDLAEKRQRLLNTRAGSFHQILIQEEERLNRLDLPAFVFDHEIRVLEILADRLFDDGIEAIIFATRENARFQAASPFNSASEATRTVPRGVTIRSTFDGDGDGVGAMLSTWEAATLSDVEVEAGIRSSGLWHSRRGCDSSHSRGGCATGLCQTEVRIQSLVAQRSRL